MTKKISSEAIIVGISATIDKISCGQCKKNQQSEIIPDQDEICQSLYTQEAEVIYKTFLAPLYKIILCQKILGFMLFACIVILLLIPPTPPTPRHHVLERAFVTVADLVAKTLPAIKADIISAYVIAKEASEKDKSK